MGHPGAGSCYTNHRRRRKLVPLPYPLAEPQRWCSPGLVATRRALARSDGVREKAVWQFRILVPVGLEGGRPPAAGGLLHLNGK